MPNKIDPKVIYCKTFYPKLFRRKFGALNKKGYGWHLNEFEIFSVKNSDLAKFTLYGNLLKFFGKLLEGLFSILQNIEHKLVNLYVIGQIFIVVNGQILSK